MGINISLFDNWRIRSDPNNIILVHETGGKEDLYFYSTIPGAIEGFIQHKIKGFDSTSLLGLKEAINQLQNRLNLLLGDYKLEVVKTK